MQGLCARARSRPPNCLAALRGSRYSRSVEYEDDRIRRILEEVSTVALVGASPAPERPSYEVMAFLQNQGYRVIPVNPRSIGELILGERVYGCLAELPGRVDMVDVFRNSDAAGAIADEAIAAAPTKGIRTVWMQIGVRDDAAAARAEAAGLQVVMDRCPKIELLRLGVRLRAPGAGRA